MSTKGFTLIETLFVLFIISTLSLLTMSIHIPHQNDEQIVEQMKQFIYRGKMNAMLNKETTYIDFSKKQISIRSTYCNETFDLPERTSFQSHQLSYNEKGNIKNAKRIYFYGHKNKYAFVFQIGCGSFYVES